MIDKCWTAISRRVGTACLTVAGALLLTAGHDTAEAKIPGKTHCYFGICHRIKTLDETARLVGTTTTVRASFYDDCKVDRFNPCTLTSSGEVFKPHRPDNAASPIYPDGTKLLLWNPKSGLAAIVRVNSAGPYHSNRTLDVSRATAERLGFKRTGVANLHVQVLSAPTQSETRYKKHRVYDPVPGPIGRFDRFELAMADSARQLLIYDAPIRVASAARSLVPAALRVNPLPLDNAKAVNAAGRNATVAVMASVAGGPNPTTTISASAVLMNSIPHSLLPAGVLTGQGPTRRGRRTVVASARRD